MADFERFRSDQGYPQKEGVRFLVESALRKIVSEKQRGKDPRNREEWMARLCAALTDDSEQAYQSLIAAMMANGISTEEIYDSYVPEAARVLGEMWVQDRASFVDVTVGASRLQELFRSSDRAGPDKALARCIPLGQSVLMVVPTFEDHSIGAFVVADQFRRHGLWVHMAIGLDAGELRGLTGSGRFAMVGITSGSAKTLEPLADLIESLRADSRNCPPIVVGGYIVTKSRDAEKRIGADFVVRTAREAIERCGLASVAESLSIDAGP